eukprot:TRINITY_DN2797_c0_g1_i1.p1 TRINITY_DN2797_c0_g1~~TRINITY_DN2797_c0_g1_i1.p1  ORF type:complete len:435 (-),score=93.80 TRINITY_DN2797_c0_g1_i1:383-1687(-)
MKGQTSGVLTVNVTVRPSDQNIRGSCLNLCGRDAADCACDLDCERNGDCCPDFMARCEATFNKPSSCPNKCSGWGTCDCFYGGNYTNTITTISSRQTNPDVSPVPQSNLTRVDDKPWQGRVSVSDIYVCAGSLIHPRWVLTSGDCLFTNRMKVHPSKMKLTFKTAEGENVQVNVRNTFVPEGYTPRTYADLGLIELSEPVTTVQPISLVSKRSTAEGITLSLFKNDKKAGSGSLNTFSQYLTPRTHAQCLTSFGLDPRREMCAELSSLDGPLVQLCRTDEGSPLTDPEGSVLQAVLKRSTIGCQSDEFPTFTLISPWMSWIKRIMEGNHTDLLIGSCKNNCGGQSLTSNGTFCYCDYLCPHKKDCCEDMQAMCGTNKAPITPKAFSGCRCNCTWGYTGPSCDTWWLFADSDASAPTSSWSLLLTLVIAFSCFFF